MVRWKPDILFSKQIIFFLYERFNYEKKLKTRHFSISVLFALNAGEILQKYEGYSGSNLQ
jgi:hypothetical protein